MATTEGLDSESTLDLVKRILVGRRMPTHRLEHTLLPKVLALPVFSSDALSSVAYATEQILFVLLAASASAYHLVMPISLAIGALMVIVVASYRQTVRAYPSGGGAYIVSKENLGVLPGLVAALLTDYVLTVSVSVVAGVFAITSAIPGLTDVKVELSIGLWLSSPWRTCGACGSRERSSPFPHMGSSRPSSRSSSWEWPDAWSRRAPRP